MAIVASIASVLGRRGSEKILLTALRYWLAADCVYRPKALKLSPNSNVCISWRWSGFGEIHALMRLITGTTMAVGNYSQQRATL